MSYKVGDKVWCRFNRSDRKITGELPAVVCGPGGRYLHPELGVTEYSVEVSIPGQPKVWETWEKRLRPRKDPGDEVYDGNQAVRWDQCPWRPTVREATKETADVQGHNE